MGYTCNVGFHGGKELWLLAQASLWIFIAAEFYNVVTGGLMCSFSAILEAAGEEEARSEVQDSVNGPLGSVCESQYNLTPDKWGEGTTEHLFFHSREA